MTELLHGQDVSLAVEIVLDPITSTTCQPLYRPPPHSGSLSSLTSAANFYEIQLANTCCAASLYFCKLVSQCTMYIRNTMYVQVCVCDCARAQIYELYIYSCRCNRFLLYNRFTLITIQARFRPTINFEGDTSIS